MRQLAVDHMQISPAYAAGVHAHQQLAAARLGIGKRCQALGARGGIQ
jgi:hypothetical protein